MIHKVYLGLGSNQGDRAAKLAKAIELINERVGPVIRQSSVIETEPWGFLSGNKFLNCAVYCVNSDVIIRARAIATVPSTSTSFSTTI